MTEKKTALHAEHLAAGGKMVDFAGWQMPIHYGSQIEEHHAVRRHAGCFDVSHMAAVDIKGADAKAYLRHLLANDVAKLVPGKALYSCLLKQDAGILDDLIVYHIADDYYRIVVNAGTREKDIAWFKAQCGDWVLDIDERTDLSIVAVQGPKARSLAWQVLSAELVELTNALKPFHFAYKDDVFVARTGYTGEDGFEIMLPNCDVEVFWRELLKAGVQACGLGARDTLRLEAGMNLYGTDMDESTSPLVSGLAWTVDFKDAERNFIGKEALLAQKQQGLTQQFVALVLEERGVLRGHQKVLVNDAEQGELTSGSFSPTLNCAIGFARVNSDCPKECMIAIRNKQLPARIVKAPFVRKGEKVFE